MTQFHVLARRLALAGFVACVFASALSAWPSVSEARKAKSAAPPAGPSPQGPQAANGDASEAEAAKKAYDAGLKAYAAGKYQSSIEQLSSAVKSGKLAPTELAKAIMTRGLAYKRDNKPGLAISDLTAAIWLKNGLGPADQKAAINERSEAYRLAGLPDTGSTPDQRAIGTPLSSSGQNVAAGQVSGPNAGSAGLSAGAIAEAANAQKAEAKSDAASGQVAQTGVNGETTLQSAANSGVVSAEAKPASSGIAGFFGWGQSAPAQEPAPQPEASSGKSFVQNVTSIPGNVSGFFSNIFSGGQANPAPDSGVSTGSNQSLAGAATAPETSSWNSQTTAPSNRVERESFKAEKASYAPEPSAKATALTKGKFKIHIAALRSKPEADALAQKLLAEHGAELGNHVPIVDSAVIGSMGTFYRVRIGGYATQDEPRSLCNKLRSSGLDCLVVTN